LKNLVEILFVQFREILWHYFLPKFYQLERNLSFQSLFKTLKFDVSLELCEYCVLPWKLVAPPFYYVEKGDENNGDVSCSVFATLFFCLVKQETKFRGKNFMKFCKILFASRNGILRNFAK
jgi:hypothetical protein